jgi:hypothetical protein
MKILIALLLISMSGYQAKASSEIYSENTLGTVHQDGLELQLGPDYTKRPSVDERPPTVSPLLTFTWGSSLPPPPAPNSGYKAEGSPAR